MRKRNIRKQLLVIFFVYSSLNAFDVYNTSHPYTIKHMGVMGFDFILFLRN
jgi:hypothetical protein